MLKSVVVLCFLLFCVDGLNLILKQPQVIEQFQKLQEREKSRNNHEGERAKIVPMICGIVNEKINFGQGQDLYYVTKGVGKCVKTRPLRHSNEHQIKACPSSHVCLPSKANTDTIMTISGPRTSISATHCQCADPDKPCQRLPNIRVYHSGTVFEKTIDIGECVGGCQAKKGHKGCQAVSTKVVSIHGPNGAQCVQKITKCACTRGCYRVSHRQTFKTTHFDEKAKTNRTQEIVVDVGRCYGGCNGKKRSEKCIYWTKQKAFRGKARMVCLFKSSKNSPTSCLPHVFKTHEIFTGFGDKLIINTVKRCGCS